MRVLMAVEHDDGKIESWVLCDVSQAEVQSDNERQCVGPIGGPIRVGTMGRLVLTMRAEGRWADSEHNPFQFIPAVRAITAPQAQEEVMDRTELTRRIAEIQEEANKRYLEQVRSGDLDGASLTIDGALAELDEIGKSIADYVDEERRKVNAQGTDAT